MTKREIIGSIVGLIVSIGVTVLVMSFMFRPNHPNFAAMVGTIVIVFVLIEVARNLWIHRRRRSSSQ
ncbi:hypothetical protein StoSoilA2_11790 [Arthrobacter sp. StoSoilA2]|uniref:hypothetical protein n=1 Tax=Arthrobacter sp. StoSoilA2 TaxID=2830990 RepID=UPI001CC35B4F|nr:hypothetical protein [Arthrobacter sp. StoSoilA2]BCW35123.1 hypothetical protein StoSoilA2_11790 [Arthrobacter sp. StoSoilA2]